MKIIQPINKTALFIATISFVLGTSLLLFFLISQYRAMIDIGIFYVMVAFTLNVITFVGLIANSIINYKHYKENLTTIAVVVINIPITIGYINIVLTNSF
ncbi:hypothetical protein [Aquimarina sp. I32.4]|uniref:hypothetical protein n=1 Tax=Aquimarina sp. I32.4 TaxID=2053903 RepID=UPI000CDE5AC4|nr:hypothetical protein [Aquimarina sp. I32.4]